MLFAANRNRHPAAKVAGRTSHRQMPGTGPAGWGRQMECRSAGACDQSAYARCRIHGNAGVRSSGLPVGVEHLVRPFGHALTNCRSRHRATPRASWHYQRAVEAQFEAADRTHADIILPWGQPARKAHERQRLCEPRDQPWPGASAGEAVQRAVRTDDGAAEMSLPVLTVVGLQVLLRLEEVKHVVTPGRSANDRPRRTARSAGVFHMNVLVYGTA